MQLKIKRSQREGGIISKHAVFMLDARVVFTQTEQQHVDRYKLWNEHIYSSESAKKSWVNAELSKDGSTTGGLKALTHSLVAAFKLNVTVGSIYNGQHISCKSLDELIYAEECIKTACKVLREYLDVAATFNGSEVLYEIEGGEAHIVARSITPEPALITAPNDHSPSSEEQVAYAEYEEYEPEPRMVEVDNDTASTERSGIVVGDWLEQNKTEVLTVGVIVFGLFFITLLIFTLTPKPQSESAVTSTTTEYSPINGRAAPATDEPEAETAPAPIREKGVWYRHGKPVPAVRYSNGTVQPPCSPFSGNDDGSFECIDE